jgi:hypothetical protein
VGGEPLDEAYSLLDIFNVHTPLIYDEGRNNAFTRLWEEIDKVWPKRMRDDEGLKD